LEFEVDRSVLIPRADTETLVENVLQLSRNQPGMEAPRVLDLCTGSGCVAAAIASRIKTATVLATDVSEGAVAVAKKNFERLGLSERVAVEQGDLFEAVKGVEARPFDLIVGNPPYIPSGAIGELDKSVREYEPIQALDGGLDGLAIHRRILAGAAERLASGGRFFLEIGWDQGEAAKEAAKGQWEDVRVLKDYGGKDRVLTGLKAGKA
jgi:release factor glutamine methyltransferase